MKIQKPTLGRVVEYHCKDTNLVHVGLVFRGDEDGNIDLGYMIDHIGMTHRREAAARQVPLADYRKKYAGYANWSFADNVPHDASGAVGTWRYPPRCDEEIVVSK